MSWMHAARARLSLLIDRRGAESRMNEEFRFHVEMEGERLQREHGLDASEARRRALVAFGGVEKHKESLRDGRGLAWLGGLSLDLRLGARMLVRYPGLTLVGGLAIAFAVWAGVVVFQMAGLFLSPTLPLPDGDRVVYVQLWNTQASAPESRTLATFVAWRRSLRTVTDLGAWRDVTRNLVAADGDVRPVGIAEITAEAFRIAPERPLLGRTLTAEDETAAAPPVAVLGYDLWRQRFASDSGVVGRTVHIGHAQVTVVGVMPEGFAFPLSHELWMPLHAELEDRGPLASQGITMFGRLAAGVSRDEAQAELVTIGRRDAARRPSTHAHLQPRVLPYTSTGWEPAPGERRILWSINGFALLLLALVCSNVALLLFARAATRGGEIVVRTALGASRGRIVAQLVAEALVLGGVAAAVGLIAADVALRRWGVSFLERNLGPLPFWYDLRISGATIAYACALTAIAALIAGAMPALRVTRDLGARLKERTAGGGGVRFGGMWTAVVVIQVAFTVLFPVAAYVMQRELVRIRSQDVGFAADEYLAVRLDMDGATIPPAGADSAAWRAARQARFASSLQTLRDRLAAEPGVTGVTFADRLPRMFHRERFVEVDDTSGMAAASDAAPTATDDGAVEVSLASVDASYFDALGAPILAGRGFRAADQAEGANVVIVDQGFVNRVLHGRNAVGRRIRFAPPRRATASPAAAGAEPRPWLQIVGVVKDLGMAYPTHRGRQAGLYLPARPGMTGTTQMAVHVRGDPVALASRLRAAAATVDPTMRLSEFQRLDQVANDVLWVIGLWLRITAVLCAVAVLLSLAGIYAVLSYTVARRTREIGLRVALGASRGRVIAAIFRRPLTEVGAGIVAGGLLVGIVAGLQVDGGLSAAQVALLGAYALLMFGVCSLACIVPTRRALRVEPSVALRVE